MGVPAFFRWLSRKYPSIVVHCIEQKLKQLQGTEVPIDATLPNPNGVEFDNLYLDMNGIIHPCCHPEDKPAPENEEEMMVAIFEYIDRIFNLVRPRRVLYMAIDGVAPRAKMNQQRSRRFRSAKESLLKIEDIKKIREDLRQRGCELPPLKPDSAHFDSNCITPGTEFMANLSICLQYYIHDRMNTNPAWKNIKIILSDANVPGEGEHKVMDYIRKQRASPDHDPNTHHCLCGADADLIMLGLATHEPYFTILREEFKPNTPRPCEICNQYGHSMKECTGEAKIKQGEFDELSARNLATEKEFIFIRLNVLREYLQRDLRMSGLNFKYDFERVVDDWVFMCFFVGNDFLPHLPSLQIREGAIDRLIRLYKDVIPSTGGYLTHNGYVDVKRAKMILSELGLVEDEIFRNRRERDLMEKERQKFKRRRQEDYRAPRFIPEKLTPVPIGSTPTPAFDARHDAYQMRRASTLTSNQEAAQSIKSLLKRSKDSGSTTSSGASTPSQEDQEDRGKDKRSWKSEREDETERMKRKRKADDERRGDDTESDTEDEIRLWEDGWKERYYQSKYCVSCEDSEFIQQVVESYTEGLCWVMAYYYQGCPSWKWFFPFHYAPFASDFKYIVNVNDTFERGTLPFRPLEQLMGVFPAASCKFLPPSWQDLMLNEDSPVIDFYPSDFKIDLNGKKFAWQGVALLPFVNERRLLKALDKVYDTLTFEETSRNSLGCDYIFMHKCNKLYSFAHVLYEGDHTHSDMDIEPVLLNTSLSGGLSGNVWINEKMAKILSHNGTVETPLPQLKDIYKTSVICLNYRDPQFQLDYEFQAQLLPGIVPPPPTLKPEYMSRGPPGSYNPQTGFSPPVQRSYSTPQPARRIMRNALSDPRTYSRGPYSSRGNYPPPPHYSMSYDSPDHMYSSPQYGRRPSQYPPPHRPSGPPSASWSPLPPPPPHSPAYHPHSNQPYHGHSSYNPHSNYPHTPGGHFIPPPQSDRHNYKKPSY